MSMAWPLHQASRPPETIGIRSTPALPPVVVSDERVDEMPGVVDGSAGHRYDGPDAGAEAIGVGAGRVDMGAGTCARVRARAIRSYRPRRPWPAFSSPVPRRPLLGLHQRHAQERQEPPPARSAAAHEGRPPVRAADEGEPARAARGRPDAADGGGAGGHATSKQAAAVGSPVMRAKRRGARLDTIGPSHSPYPRRSRARLEDHPRPTQTRVRSGRSRRAPRRGSCGPTSRAVIAARVDGDLRDLAYELQRRRRGRGGRDRQQGRP